jgi:hypothetical protein
MVEGVAGGRLPSAMRSQPVDDARGRTARRRLAVRDPQGRKCHHQSLR